MQQYWSRKFEIPSNSVWEKIYREKIKKIFDKSVAEFNFKMLHNLEKKSKKEKFTDRQTDNGRSE
jgi:hypothetical protein